MNFEEKIDAMRMTLELAIQDIEAQRSAIHELRLVSASQSDNIRDLMKISGELVETARSHEQRIATLERRA